MEENINGLIEVIRKNIGKRKLILRWKDEQFEKLIFDNLGIKAAFYVTRVRERINNIDTFSDNVLAGKKDKYYLVIVSSLKWSKVEEERYFAMGGV